MASHLYFRRLWRLMAVGLLIYSLITPTLAQSIRWVKQGATGDGTSWQNASGNLQAMLDVPGVEQVWVAKGIYMPAPLSESNLKAGFKVPNGVGLYGGFEGTESTIAERPPIATDQPSSTTLSGANSIITDPYQQEFHVVSTTDGATNQTRFDGLTISDGINYGNGAGMFIRNGSPTLINCSFIKNKAYIGDVILASGGGLYILNGSPTLTNCNFIENVAGGAQTSASFGGGGLAILNGNPTLTNCNFIGNKSGGHGGGLAMQKSSPTLINCNFIKNSTNYDGCQGGGMYTQDASPALTNCRFLNNDAITTGGAMSLGRGSPTLTNCTLIGNTAWFMGGILVTGTPILTNCTILAENAPFTSGATGISVHSGKATLINCIVWRRSAEEGYEDSNPPKPVFEGSIIARHSLIKGYPYVVDSQGSSGLSPSFVDPANGDLRLQSCSAAIDAGETAAYTGPDTDFAGNPRQVRTIDMGAYEFQGEPNTVSQDYAPLAALFIATNGDKWRRSANWMSGCSPCNWFGVTCDNNGRVVSLDLKSNQLSGTLPASLSELTHLKYLDLSENGLPGSIPSNIGALTELQYLNLSSSIWSGTIPESLGALTKLQTLNLSRNQLSGCFPASLSALCGINNINSAFSNNPALPGGGDFAAFCADRTGSCAPANTPPQPTAIVSQTATVGKVYSFSANAFTDTETPNSLTYSASIDPANGLNFDPVTQIISGTPLASAVSQVTLTATDPGGLSAVTTFTITSITACAPQSLSLLVSGPLNCLTTSVTLTAVGYAESATISFSGPGIQSTNLNTATVNQPGSYSVVAQIAMGCSATALATVQDQRDTPPAPTLAASALMTNQPISVTANGCPDGTINWALLGGNGLANGSVYSITQPGNYTLSATCRVGSCTSEASVPLSLQIIPSGFAITEVLMVSCQLIDDTKGGYQVQFTPQYAGRNANPISFSVVNELSPTMAPAPYTLKLYTDNPIITLVANQAGNAETRFSYNWRASCQTDTHENNPPTTRGIPNQTALHNQAYQLDLASYFSDPDQQSLKFTATGLPTGLSLNGSQISGVPSATGVSMVSITALDPDGLSAQTSFQLTVNSSPTNPSGFTIVGVSTATCEILSATQRRVTFTPLYEGLSGDPISFSVVNEMMATTNPGPYSLNLYTDNPSVTLNARQLNALASFAYNWLAICTSMTRLGVPEAGTGLKVKVLGNPIEGKSIDVEISGVSGQAVELNLLDLQGRALHQQHLTEASNLERVTVPIGTGKSVLFLQVNTATERQQVKLLKP
ncbi:hypothetical protein G8759_30195 [Spirosoma aureum]|uniref:Dystroglycan-type cadherin-like domain-containing protein n=1 Tax=Spirosoma aureum TaxID=2692134 RepID=A0A6G9AW76_9BACT|nr:putative Ig domain-containing protein [Spirosoma aureum]QIP16608.1 hypothetical protein G8759_30195 [Spirosoma aureum]